MSAIAEDEASSAQEMQRERLIEIGHVAERCRDHIFDLLVRLSRRRIIEGFAQNPETTPYLWETLETDPDPFMMSLDFQVNHEGIRLARVVGPWACLPQAMHQDKLFRAYVSEYLRRRFVGNGMVAVRTLDYGAPYGDGYALTRAVGNAGKSSQWADLNSDWSDAAELSGAWFQAPLFAAVSGLFALPPESVPLLAPLWTSLLDEPALMVYLRRAYPYEPTYGNAEFDPGGRTIVDQTGIKTNRPVGIRQDLGYETDPERMELLRYFVDDERVLGCSILREAQLKHAASGIVIGVTPQWET